MALDRGTSTGARLLDSEVWVLLGDELPIAGEERLGGGKKAERGAGVLDVGPEATSSDCDRRVLPSLEDSVCDR